MKNRNNLIKYLKKNSIQFGIHYPLSINQLKCFKNIFRKDYVTINLGIIQRLINEKKIAPENPLDFETLLKVGLLKKKNNNIKILAKGDFKSKIKFVGFNFSKNAKIVVEKNGGTFEKLINK